MAKQPSDKLNRLIESLSSAEKRYFKQFTKIYGGERENKYEKLFNLIESDPGISDQEIISREGFIDKDHLPNLKMHLYEVLLRSLRNFHSEKNVNWELKELLLDIQLLFDKGLNEQAGDKIEKGIELAEKNEYFFLLLEFLYYKSHLLHAGGLEGAKEIDVTNLSKKIARYIKSAENWMEFRSLSTKIYLHEVHQGQSRESIHHLERKKIIEKSILRNISYCLSDKAKIIFYLSHPPFLVDKGNYEKAYNLSKELTKLLDAKPHYVIEQNRVYVSAYINFLTCQFLAKKYKEIPETITRLKNPPFAYETVQKNKMFFTAYFFELQLALETGEIQKGVQLISEIELFASKANVPGIQQLRMVLQIKSASLLIAAGKFSEANRHINLLLNNFFYTDIRLDVTCSAKILSMLIHFEMGNTELLEYAVRACYRFLLKRERLYKFENIVLRFIRNDLIKKYSEKDLKTAFGKLKKKLDPLAKDPFEKGAFEDFDYISWLESKITGRSFTEILQEKAKPYLE